MKQSDLLVRPWRDYELIDSGDGRKLERFGAVTVIRPETQALWAPSRPEEWKRAAAEFVWANGKGAWRTKSDRSTPRDSEWELEWEGIRAALKLTSFKHVGIFPEQAANWAWIAERVRALRAGSGAGAGRDAGASAAADGAPRILNLFGYTGLASIVAAKHGARVTHVDASRQSNVWAKENAARSGIGAEHIRFLLDDALKFSEREARRGADRYDGIILDPPAFGRGAKGEVWHIEEDLPKLLATLAKILSRRRGAFFLLNGYAAGYAPRSFVQAVESAFGAVAGDALRNAEFGEIQIEEKTAARVVPSGIYVRFVS